MISGFYYHERLQCQYLKNVFTFPSQMSDCDSLPSSGIITVQAASLKHLPVVCFYMKCLGLHFSDICALETSLLVAHRL